MLTQNHVQAEANPENDIPIFIIQLFGQEINTKISNLRRPIEMKQETTPHFKGNSARIREKI